MLHRVKKQQDENKDKWIGVGGKLEYGESPIACVRREITEETGLTVEHPDFRGIITFVSDEWGVEYMYLFTADQFSGSLSDCDEGELEWVDFGADGSGLARLNLWEGDRIFLQLLQQEAPFFFLTLHYQGGEAGFAPAGVCTTLE
jgi:8-oxo-dGTP diphosphatase